MSFNDKFLKSLPNFFLLILFICVFILTFSFAAIADDPQGGDTESKVEIVPYRDLISNTESKVSVKFVNADVRDVLGALSASFGYETVFVGSPVKISVALENSSIHDAFASIAENAGFKCSIDEQTVYVSDSDTLEKLKSKNVTADFEVNNTDPDYILSKLETVGIEVEISQNDSLTKVFSAHGKSQELIRLRRLISMIDNAKSISSGSDTGEQMGLYTITTEHIPARDFSRILFSLSLPGGIYDHAPGANELVVYTTPSSYSKILAAKEICDKKTDGQYPSESSLHLAKVSTNHLSNTVAGTLLDSLLDLNPVKYDAKGSSLWVYATKEQINYANKILLITDVEAPVSPPEHLRMITLDFIPALDFEKLLLDFGIKETYVYEDNTDTLFVFADSEALKDIDTLRLLVDRADYLNEEAKEIVFHKFEPQFASKAAAEEYLSVVGCGAKIVDLFGTEDSVWLYGDDAAISYAIEMLALLDTEHYKDGYTYRVYNIVNTDFFKLSDKLLFDEEFAQYADFYYIIPIDDKNIIIAAHPFSVEEIYRSIIGFDTKE